MGRVGGKTALITGAASGLGRAAALMLAREGANVALSDINVEGGQALEQEIGADARFFAHDVTDPQAWQDVVSGTVEAFGGLNILVNSAGIAITKSIEDTSLEEWHHLHAVDLDSVFLGCKYAISAMAQSGGGSIVNISSISGIIAGHNLAAYNSAKAGVRLLSKSVALHCARKGYNIRSNSVHPAFVDTPILDAVVGRFGHDEGIAKLARQIPLGRVGKPEEIAYGILYLASDESSFMTGAELVLDGGASAM